MDAVAVAGADGEQDHITTAPAGSPNRCCRQLSCFSFKTCQSFSHGLQKARSASLSPAAPSALATGLHPSVAPNIEARLQWRNPLPNPLPSPRQHECLEARCLRAHLPGWFCPFRAIPPVCSSLPVTLTPRQLQDEILCSMVGYPRLPPSQDTTALVLSQGQNMSMSKEEGSEGAGNEGERCIWPVALPPPV